MTATARTRKRYRGWWYPLIFVAGFGVVFTVNMVMAYFATSTFSGLATEQPYLEGLAYDEKLANVEAQRALGWDVTFDMRDASAQNAALPRDVELTAGFLDAYDRPIDGLDVQMKLRRPTVEGYDQTVTLLPVGPGRYAAAAQAPLLGQWELRLTALGEDDLRYHLRKRVVLR